VFVIVVALVDCRSY